MQGELRNFDYERYYRENLRVVSLQGNQLKAYCPFHEDSTPSFSVRISDGVWNCFGCQKQGNMFQFHALKNNIGISQAIQELTNTVKIVDISADIIQKAHEKLSRNKDAFNFLVQKRGFEVKTIKKYKLGYGDDGRIWIPICQNGRYINVRRYDWQKLTDYKFLPYASGLPKEYATSIYPYENMIHTELYLMEGELDCILANQLGYNAITITGGAKTFPQNYISLFKDKKVIVCYDIDDAGKKGAIEVVNKLKNVVEEIRVVNLDITTPENGDFTDYIITHKRTKEQFNELVSTSEVIKKIGQLKIDDSEPIIISLEQSAHEKYFNKKVKYNVIVVGKDLTPYTAPRKIKVTCENKHAKSCMGCSLFANNGLLEHSFEWNNINLLSLIRCSDQQKKGFIKQNIGIHSRCEKFNIEILDSWTIEDVRVIPDIDFSNQNIQYTTRGVFVISYNIETNRSYTFKGIVLADPTNQYITQIVYKYEPLLVSIDNFELTDDIIKELGIFQVEGKGTL